jgi:hypothetical protein
MIATPTGVDQVQVMKQAKAGEAADNVGSNDEGRCLADGASM